MNTESAEYKRILGKEKIFQAGNLAGSGINDIKSGVSDSLNEGIVTAKEKAASQYDTVAESAEIYSEKAKDKIRTNPLISVGSAFAAGWLFSKLVK